MKNEASICPICDMQLDDNHFAPVSFPGIDREICCNCGENLGLMFANFKDKPGSGNGFIVPDNTKRLEKITGRSYIENRLIYYQNTLSARKSKENYD